MIPVMVPRARQVDRGVYAAVPRVGQHEVIKPVRADIGVGVAAAQRTVYPPPYDPVSRRGGRTTLQVQLDKPHRLSRRVHGRRPVYVVLKPPRRVCGVGHPDGRGDMGVIVRALLVPLQRFWRVLQTLPHKEAVVCVTVANKKHLVGVVAVALKSRARAPVRP